MASEDTLPRKYYEITFLIHEIFGLTIPAKFDARQRNSLYELFQEVSIDQIILNLRDFNKSKLTSELFQLINIFTVNHTFFYREHLHFEFLRNEILADCVEKFGIHADNELRIWSAASSTGEEAYSLLFSILKFKKNKKFNFRFKVLATDIDLFALKSAKSGVFSIKKLKNISQYDKSNYFLQVDEANFQIKREIKKQVMFKWLNLNAYDYPMRQKFHVIFCRNVLIYLSKKSQRHVLKKLIKYLHPGGYLILGSGEASNVIEKQLLPLGNSVFRKK